MTTDATAALIAVSELTELLKASPPPVLLDVRWQVAAPSQHPAYLASHIPGAHWCDLDADLADPPGARGRHPLPDPQRLQRRVIEWGINPDSTVVVYDGSDSVAAARAWWVLRWAGLRTVLVLDGGLQAWVNADRPISIEIPAVGSGTAEVLPDSLATLTADTAASAAHAGVLIDVRAPERFRGEVEPMDPIAGHIPGAINIPATDNVTAAGGFKPAAVLGKQFAQSGVHERGDAVGVYCGSGVTASQTMLALHLAGIEAVLYPGSWSDWITDDSRPVATG